VDVRLDDLSGPQIARLLQEHLRSMRQNSPPESSGPAFAPALSLYTRFGFRPCGPFADYAEDPFSVFMARDL
jgi:putative acetyltransferase